MQQSRALACCLAGAVATAIGPSVGVADARIREATQAPSRIRTALGPDAVAALEKPDAVRVAKLRAAQAREAETRTFKSSDLIPGYSASMPLRSLGSTETARAVSRLPDDLR